MLIKDWYIEQYTTDEMAQEINDNVTFAMIVGTLLTSPDDIYDTIGVHDSLIRERIFLKLSMKLCVSYDVVYNLWLK